MRAAREMVQESDWDKCSNLEEKIKFLLKYAILAPSTHNSQPWLFKVEGNSCKIFSDPFVDITYADPKERDLNISLGCCIENLIIAAKYFGIYKDIEYKFDFNLIAEIFFKEGEKKGKDWKYLLDTIPKRINVRGQFDNKQIPNKIIERVGDIKLSEDITLHHINKKDEINSIATLTGDAIKEIYHNKNFRKEMSFWMHNSYTKKKDGLPGYALAMPTALSFIIPKAIRFIDIGSLLAKLNFKSISSAQNAYVITSNKEDASTWVKIGRLAERIMLELQSQGLRTSIFVASIEIGDFQARLQKSLHLSEKPQFLFIFGYMDRIQRVAPRHSLIKKLL